MNFIKRKLIGYVIDNTDEMYDFDEDGVCDLHICSEKLVKKEAKMIPGLRKMLKKVEVTVKVLELF